MTASLSRGLTWRVCRRMSTSRQPRGPRSPPTPRRSSSGCSPWTSSSGPLLQMCSRCPSPHLTSPPLPSPALTSPHLTSPYLTSPYLTSSQLTSPDLTSPHLTLCPAQLHPFLLHCMPHGSCPANFPSPALSMGTVTRLQPSPAQCPPVS